MNITCYDYSMALPMGSYFEPPASECPDVKNYKCHLNPVWHRILYSCTHMATVA